MTVATVPAAWKTQASEEASEDQIGALPYRLAAGKVLFLAITSRRTGRWIFPKGSLIDGLTASQSAAQEAYEEAGVKGSIEDVPLGSYVTLKQRAGESSLINVFAFAMEVDTQMSDWPEREERTRLWLDEEEAARMISDPGAVVLMRELAARLSQQP